MPFHFEMPIHIQHAARICIALERSRGSLKIIMLLIHLEAAREKLDVAKVFTSFPKKIPARTATDQARPPSSGLLIAGREW